MIYFISDTHFGHKNIGPYCNRPENHEQLIWSNLFKIVKSNDTLWHLGDVCMAKKKQSDEIVKRLPGRNKILVRGNHDRSSRVYQSESWSKVYSYKEVVYNDYYGIRVAISHRPEDLDNVDADIVLSGHVHNLGLPYYRQNNQLWFNLCVEQCNYTPVSINEIIKIYNQYL